MASNSKLPKYTHKLFDKDGLTFLEMFRTAEVVSVPKFAYQINGGQGQMRMQLQRNFGDTPANLQIGRIVKVFESSENYPQGKLIYTGHINNFRPFLRPGGEGIEIELHGLPSTMTWSFYRTGGGAYDVPVTGVDVADVVKGIIDHYRTVYGTGLLYYTGGSIPATGQTMTYTFSKMTHLGAVNKALEFAPADYFWRVDPDGLVSLLPTPSTAEKSFTIDRDIVSADADRTSDDLINSVRVEYTGGVATAEDATSISTFGRRTRIVQSQDTTDATTAQNQADSLLAELKDPKVNPTLSVVSPAVLVDILPGQTCNVKNFPKDSGIFQPVMRIERIDFGSTIASLKLTSDDDSFGKVFNDAVTKTV